MTPGTSPQRSAGLATRLLAAQILVVLTCALTAWVVASVAGPPLFHDHLQQAEATDHGDEMSHAEEAFASATAISLSVALLAALAAAFLASWYVTRRIGRSVAAVGAAAADVAAGRYDAHVPPPGLGVEFDALAGGFNQMAGKLAAVETTRRRLLADLAHEMRTPVATIDAYLEGIEDGVAILDDQTLGVLRGQTGRLARLAEDIKAVSQAEEHRLQLSRHVLRPQDVVSRAVATAAAEYDAKGVALSIAIPDRQLPQVDADPDRLAQVLGNLLDNALRHTPSGGLVTVGLAAVRGGVQIVVTDTGAGIPAEHLPHVFERFYRVDTARDRQHGGSGIGLAISKALVDAHGGRISADSLGPGQGSTFRVWLPSAR